MEAIKNLEQLHHNLNLGPGYGGYSELLKAVDFSPDEIQSLSIFSEDHYQRIRLYDSNLVEAVLTCWKPNQVGKIHDFHRSKGWFKVLQGSIFLERFKFRSEGPKVSYQNNYSELRQGFLTDDLGFHRFSNPHQCDAVVLFIYADKINSWDVFDSESGQVKRLPAEVDYNLDVVSS